MSTLIRAVPQAIPSARCAHLGPTPRNEPSTASSQGNSPPYRSTVTWAISRICSAFAVRNVVSRMSPSIRDAPSAASAAGVGAAAKSRRAATRLTSSRLRMERMQATSCWNSPR
jgi:hypothetical protein